MAKTALWIAESQMMRETEDIMQKTMDFLPLKTNANIVEGNALRLDWRSVVSPNELNYIMGNPPFVGYSLQNPEQKAEMLSIYRDEKDRPYKTAGKIDYVAAWYWKAAEFMRGLEIKAALVSTNSITQGEQVAAVWKPLYERFGIHIDFAWRTFRWDSESSGKAHVHCVIIGFSCTENNKQKTIYDGENRIAASNINAYLIDADDIFVESRKKPLCDVPEMLKGSSPVDGGHLIIEEEDYEDFVKKAPQAKKYIRQFVGAAEFIQGKKRYCLWLDGAEPNDINGIAAIRQRVEAVRNFRLSSTKEATRRFADYPARFMEIRQPKTDYILIPRHSSESRRYIPIRFLSPECIASDANIVIPNAGLYEFGILSSNVHMAWVRMVCGRLEMRYRYSNDIVYNNFPWPNPTAEQRKRIEATAQAILDARKLSPNSTLSALYGPVSMPPELLAAHRANDKAVMQASTALTSKPPANPNA